MLASSNERLFEQRSRQVPKGPYNVTPLFIKEAKGALVIDVEGKEYIDFAGGIGVCNVGHCPDEVVTAIKDQAEKFIHSAFHLMMYQPYIELAGRLNQATPGNFEKKTMFVNSGAEAVENAVKAARSYTKKSGIICFEHAFHGRTLLALTLTSKVNPYKLGFGPFAPEVYRVPFAYCYRCSFELEYPSCGIRCADYLKDVFHTYVSPQNIAALVVEPILGEGGFIIPPKEFFPRIKKICQESGIVFIADEIQTGFGRTGKMFAMEHFEIAPDIVVTAKSLSGGMPLGGITGKLEIMDSAQVGGLGGTFGGNPLACRAALAVFEIMEKHDLISKARRIGRMILERFKKMQEKYDLIGDTRGLGAMVAMELVKDRTTKEPAREETKLIIRKCYENGLILMPAGTYDNVIRTLMPLVITEEQLQDGLSILERVLKDISS